MSGGNARRVMGGCMIVSLGAKIASWVLTIKNYKEDTAMKKRCCNHANMMENFEI